MLRFLKYLIIAPVAILLLIFAYANRHFVTVKFDPFDAGDIPDFSITAPLFVVIIGSIMIGVIAGGVTTWFTQGRHRRALRQIKGESEKLRADLQAAKAALPPAPIGISRRA